MRKVDELRNVIATQFACEYKAYDLNGVCNSYGIIPEDSLNPMNSKRVYVLSGLNKLSDDDVWKIARRMVGEFANSEIIKCMEPFMADMELKFSFITRRRIIDYLDSLSDMEGTMELDTFLSFIWNMSEIEDIFEETTVGQEIVSAVKNKKTMTYKELLTNRLEVKYLPDEIFMEFLECLVKPEVREGADQKKYVQGINEIIKEDGYELYISSQKSGVSCYRVGKKKVFEGELKNLIFASIGKKPDITIENSISNELKLIGDTNDCLFYNFEAGAEGLQWNTLVEWWKTKNESVKGDPELGLYGRLKESLDSEIEKVFFRTYYNYYRHPIKKNIPALVPQVYLHYDPRSKNQRNGKVVYTHQRMDFLMLLPGGMQIVFELDGKQHYSVNGKAEPALYADMVKDDRMLRLKGYEVYRFGGHEFQNEETAKQMICQFFDALFERHGIVL